MVSPSGRSYAFQLHIPWSQGPVSRTHRAAIMPQHPHGHQPQLKAHVPSSEAVQDYFPVGGPGQFLAAVVIAAPAPAPPEPPPSQVLASAVNDRCTRYEGDAETMR
jgi:hypothetical protein